MKKLFALLLAVLMMFSFAACGGEEEPNETPKTPENVRVYMLNGI